MSEWRGQRWSPVKDPYLFVLLILIIKNFTTFTIDKTHDTMTFTQGLIGNNQVAHNPSRSLFKASLSQACSTVGKVSELSSNQKTLRLPTVDLRVANGMKCRHKNGNTDKATSQQTTVWISEQST